MTKSAKNTHRSSRMAKTSRRTFLWQAGGAAVLAGGVTGFPAILRAQTQTIQFWTTQRGSEQVAVYKDIIARFEKEYPGYTVNIQPAGAETIWEKLTAGFAAKQIPDLISHLPAEPVIQLNDEGLVEPFDDVINAVGKDDFQPSALAIYHDPKRGYYTGATVVNQSSNNFWFRKDMLAEAGLQQPKYWDELIPAAKAMSKNGIYGTCFPAGTSDMGSIMMMSSLWQAGGYIVDPDLNVALNSPEGVAALEFIKEIFPYSPPGSAGYGYDQTIASFVTGRVASTAYTGRVLFNVSSQNPKIGDQVSCSAYPYRREGGRIGQSVSFTNLFIPKGGKNLEGAKLFSRWLFRKDNYVAFLHSAPGHNLPVLKSVAKSPEFLSHPLLVQYSKELEILIDNMANGTNPLKESPKHKYNNKAGQIFSSKVLTEIMQDVVVGGMSPKMAAAKGADRIAKIMAG